MPKVTNVRRRQLIRPAAPSDDRSTIGQLEYHQVIDIFVVEEVTVDREGVSSVDCGDDVQ